MQAVIMAAGRGTRMGSLTEDTPKPMLSLLGEPKLAHSIRLLPDEVTEVIVVIGYLGAVIRAYFGDTFAGKRIRYVEQTELNGSGAAIHLAKAMVGEKFLVLNGDDLYDKKDLIRMLRYDLAILAYEMEDAGQFGILETDGQGRLIKIIERPHGAENGMVNAGAYMLNKHFFEYPLVPISETEYGLPQTLVQMNDHSTIVVEKATRWIPIGTPDDLAVAEKRINEFV